MNAKGRVYEAFNVFRGKGLKLPGGGWQNIQKGRELVVQRDIAFDIDAAAHVAYICYYR